jgi:hypothetical protein
MCVRDAGLALAPYAVCGAILLAVVGGAGCSESNPGSAGNGGAKPLVQRGDVELIEAPAGTRFQDPVWLPALEKIVFARAPVPGDAFLVDLAAVAVDGAQLETLPLPDEPGCKYTSKALPEVLGDGRLGYVQQCWPGGGDVVRLMTWDAETNKVTPLVPYRLRFQQGPFACAPDLSKCVINDQAGLEESLQRLGPHGLEPLDLPLKRAGFPSWSPDGRWIALDGLPADAEGSGMETLEAPRDLYLLSGADLDTVKPLVREATNFTAAAWSADSRWLALGFEPKDRPEGLYLIDVATGRLTLVLEGDFGAPTWLPGDGRLAVPVGSDPSKEAHGDVGLYVVSLPNDWKSRDGP